MFTGYNTAPQFMTALRMDADAQMHQGVGEQVHTTHTAAFVCVVFLNFHSLLRFQLHTARANFIQRVLLKTLGASRDSEGGGGKSMAVQRGCVPY